MLSPLWERKKDTDIITAIRQDKRRATEVIYMNNKLLKNLAQLEIDSN